MLWERQGKVSKARWTVGGLGGAGRSRGVTAIFAGRGRDGCVRWPRGRWEERGVERKGVVLRGRGDDMKATMAGRALDGEACCFIGRGKIVPEGGVGGSNEQYFGHGREVSATACFVVQNFEDVLSSDEYSISNSP